MHDLGGFFGLNPALPGLYAMYQAGQALPIHAVAGPYRTRSHFEAQDLLQLGTDDAGITSGWLNRMIGEMPVPRAGTPTGLAVGIGTPVMLQGPARIGSFSPAGFTAPPPDLCARIAALNAADPLTGPAIAEGLRAQDFDRCVMSDDAQQMVGDAPRGHGGFAALAAKVGALLAASGGPRIAAFQLEGWDTHGNQMNGLKTPLSGLDAGLTTLKIALGAAWRNTMVLVMTEFGRTAAMNGTKGTDHGTATIAFVLGGDVAGGRVLTTWPGLAPGQLFQNRDLAPTLDIRSVAKGALSSHFGLSDAALARVFPGSGDARPLAGLRTASVTLDP
jgi:uncharacterized protein (DUF1501 family)